VDGHNTPARDGSKLLYHVLGNDGRAPKLIKSRRPPKRSEKTPCHLGVRSGDDFAFYHHPGTASNQLKRTFSLAWIILVVAGILEIGWAVGLKYTEGFARLWPSIATISAMAASLLIEMFHVSEWYKAYNSQHVE